MKAKIRKILTLVDETQMEMGRPVSPPVRRAVACAVIENPFAGRYAENLTPLIEISEELGALLTERCVAALGIPGGKAEGYGKAAIVGEAGELEHGALWHVPGGYAMRELLGGAKAIVPSTKKVGGLGAAIDIPIHHINAAYVRSHFDAMEVRVPDAPRSHELVFVLAMTTGPRVHNRAGGMTAAEIKVGDGQR